MRPKMTYRTLVSEAVMPTSRRAWISVSRSIGNIGMPRPRVFLWLVLLSLAVRVFCVPQEDPASTYRQNKFLQEEYALAKAPGFYFLFDLRNKKIELKSKGIVLRTWEPQRARFWGSPVSFRALALTRKTALALPQRRVIKPGEEETPTKPEAKPGEFELEALEVRDMPPIFTLEMEDGTKINVVGKEKWTNKFVSLLKWQVVMPLKTLWLHQKKRAMSLIQIGFDDQKEGQALYWALSEGIKGLIWFPPF